MSDETQPLALTETAGSSQHGTMLTLPAVAERLGVSIATVRRMLKAKKLEGAQLQRGPSGEQWTVPLATVESVLATRSKQAAQAPVTVQASAPAAALSEELVNLRRQVLELQRQLDTEQALARERLQELDRVHETFRVALMAGPQQQASKRRWWQRTNP